MPGLGTALDAAAPQDQDCLILTAAHGAHIETVDENGAAVIVIGGAGGRALTGAGILLANPTTPPDVLNEVSSLLIARPAASRANRVDDTAAEIDRLRHRVRELETRVGA